MTRTALTSRDDANQGRTGRDENLADFVAAREAALLRTAYLITGDPAAARKIVTDALGKLYLSWNAAASGEGPEDFVRRVMVRAASSPWRLRRRSWRAGHHADGEGSALWRAILALPAKQRALIVLIHHDGLSEIEAADVLGLRLDRAKAVVATARETLGVQPAA
jgi:DNA-directed RNA polymerase specialized sigma24 family protein